VSLGNVRFEVLGRETPRVGVLGASRIVRRALIDEAKGLVDVVAIAARDQPRAEAFAAEHCIPHAYGSYEELIDDPNIDVIYNALPASGHAPWSKAALTAKKHVLCEKPFGLHVDEARDLVHTAQKERRLLMEAHHWRYHPLVERAQVALSELGRAGAPVKIEAIFHGGLNNPGDIRKNPALGPGVLMDFGCYTIQWCDWVASRMDVEGRDKEPGQENFPQIAFSRVTEEGPGIDVTAQVELRFPSATGRSVSATFSCDMTDGTPFRAYVTASSGEQTVHFENPLGIDGSYLLMTRGSTQMRVDPAGPTTFGGQIRALLQALRTGEAPLTSGENIIRTQAMLDECYRVAGVVSRRDLRERALKDAADLPG
jgi:predicted dehydrogenase